MRTVQVTTNTGEPGFLDEAAVAGFRASLKGEIVFSGDEGYDQARTIWNGMIDRRPAVIVRCGDADDVAHSVNLARYHDILLAVRGGGHNVAGNAVCGGGLVIDLSAMKAIEIDTARREARVEPGCLLGELDQATQAHGLATPGGIVSTTGVSGLTLGGGFGWLSRKFGLSVDNLISAEVVTADGEKLTASASENPDLFWGIRGGGGNFGVVTSFRFRLHEVGPQIYAGLIVQPFSEARDFMRFHRDFAAAAPDELSVWLVVRHAPPLPFLPASVHGQLVLVVAFLFLGDPAEGERLMKPVREFGTPLGAHVGIASFTGWQKGFDPLNTPGARNYWKSCNLNDLNDGAIDTMIEYAQQFPSPQCEIFIPHLAGAVSRVPADATAYGHRDTPFLVNVHTRWESPADDRRCVSWARALFDATRPYSAGSVYVNFISDEGAERVHDAYPQATWERLVDLKTQYDPNNLFRLNQNIKPRE